MTEEKFELIAELIRSRGPARTAARLVLVSGHANKKAAEKAGCTAASVSNTVVRFRSTYKKIVAVFGNKLAPTN